MIRVLIVAATALLTTACDPVEVLSGKPSSRQVQYEARQESGLPPQENLWVEPVKVDTPASLATYVPPPQPTCIVEFRIRQCENGVAVDWYPS